MKSHEHHVISYHWPLNCLMAYAGQNQRSPKLLITGWWVELMVTTGFSPKRPISKQEVYSVWRVTKAQKFEKWSHVITSLWDLPHPFICSHRDASGVSVVSIVREKWRKCYYCSWLYKPENIQCLGSLINTIWGHSKLPTNNQSGPWLYFFCVPQIQMFMIIWCSIQQCTSFLFEYFFLILDKNVHFITFVYIYITYREICVCG